MAKLKVAELFYSIQGEGRFMGVPSVFLRVFGCNFKCEGFGMPRGKKSEEYIKINPDLYRSYNDLPLVSTGCDSYASWDPRFKHLSPVLSTDTIVDKIIDILPNKKWQDEHLVITGGEPLLGWQRSYPDLLLEDRMMGCKDITFETNGTQAITTDLIEAIDEWSKHISGTYRPKEVTFSVSAKLPVSGEKWEDAIKPEVVAGYERVGNTYLKFVIANEQDLADAEKAVDEYRKAGFTGFVYLMPVGGVESVYNLNNRSVADLAMRKGWRYSDRLQVPLFKNEWGT